MPFTASPSAERLARLRFRAWHRGTREADFIVGCFFNRHHAAWNAADLDWFEALLDQEDPDVMAWALRRQPVPAAFAGPLMEAFQKLDYVDIPQ